MKKSNGCDFEPQIVKSLKAGTGGEEISAHLKSCPDCRETAKIIRFFQTNVSCEPAPTNLPTAGLVWWKANLREKRRAAERAARPVFVAQIVAVIVLSFAAAGLLVYQPNFFAPIAAAFNQTLTAAGQMALSLAAVLLILVVIAATLVFTFRRWTTDK